jgi:hypothetical protein
MMLTRRSLLFLVMGFTGFTLIAFNGTLAQTGRSKSKAVSRRGGVKAIDIKAERVEQQFIREAFNLAKEYSDAGQLERSKKLLEAIIKLDGSLESVKNRIKQIDEEIMTSNSVDLKVDISQGWTRPIAKVFKGRKFRIQAAGSYMLSASLTLDANGLPKNTPTSITPSIPVGALMGMLIKDDGKKTKPFPITQSAEINPKEDAQLVVRVNVPGEIKCTGQLELHLSGYVATDKTR